MSKQKQIRQLTQKSMTKKELKRHYAKDRGPGMGRPVVFSDKRYQNKYKECFETTE